MFPKFDINKYDIGELGFLTDRCINELPRQFTYLHKIIANLSTVNGDYFRRIVRSIKPNHSKKEYKSYVQDLSLSEKKFLYSICSLITHKFIWCCSLSNVTDTIPDFIGIPWFYVSEDLGLPLVLTHASTDLYNWSLDDLGQPFCLDNLKSNYLMTGHISEEWFYLIMVAIEGVGGRAINAMINIYNIVDYDVENIKLNLEVIYNSIKDINLIIQRLPEHCEPLFFFEKLRIYISGSNDATYFPNGLLIENFDHPKISFAGESAAQSSLIQAFDIFFGIKHENSFLKIMRNYMPENHRLFIEDIEKQTPITDNKDMLVDKQIKAFIENSITELITFRKHHYKIVYDYIYKYSQDASSSINIYGNKGTGGTDPKTFLSELINDTREQINNINKLPYIPNIFGQICGCVVILLSVAITYYFIS